MEKLIEKFRALANQRLQQSDNSRSDFDTGKYLGEAKGLRRAAEMLEKYLENEKPTIMEGVEIKNRRG